MVTKEKEEEEGDTFVKPFHSIQNSFSETNK